MIVNKVLVAAISNDSPVFMYCSQPLRGSVQPYHNINQSTTTFVYSRVLYICFCHHINCNEQFVVILKYIIVVIQCKKKNLH